MEKKLDEIIELLKEILDRLPEKEIEPSPLDGLDPETEKAVREMMGQNQDA